MRVMARIRVALMVLSILSRMMFLRLTLMSFMLALTTLSRRMMRLLMSRRGVRIRSRPLAPRSPLLMCLLLRALRVLSRYLLMSRFKLPPVFVGQLAGVV